MGGKKLQGKDKTSEDKHLPRESRFKAGFLSWVIPCYRILPPFIHSVEVVENGITFQGLYREYGYRWNEVLNIKMMTLSAKGGDKNILYIRTVNKVFYFYDYYFRGDWVKEISGYHKMSYGHLKQSYFLFWALPIVLPLLDKDIEKLILPGITNQGIWLLAAGIVWFFFCYLDEMRIRRKNNI